MRRKEAFGTSGPRIVLRFFGSTDYPETLCDDPAMVERAYADGVPMGGRLEAGASPPRFVVSALMDPGTASHPGTPLQRLQIVKGWLDADTPRFRVYDVAGGDNGARVDLSTCTSTSAGEPSMCSVWTDPDHRPGQRAIYYARAIENPSCRWHRYACNAAGVRCDQPDTITDGFDACCDDTPGAVQERAWSSPIWVR